MAMKDVRQIRIISPEPVLAEILWYHKPVFISREGWEWIVSWLADIGTLVRSREYMASFFASLVYYAAIEGIIIGMKRLRSGGLLSKFLRR